MEAGVDVLIEKPLAATLGEADELIRVASSARTDGAGGASGAVQSGGSG